MLLFFFFKKKTFSKSSAEWVVGYKANSKVEKLKLKI